MPVDRVYCLYEWYERSCELYFSNQRKLDFDGNNGTVVSSIPGGNSICNRDVEIVVVNRNRCKGKFEMIIRQKLISV